MDKQQCRDVTQQSSFVPVSDDNSKFVQHSSKRTIISPSPHLAFPLKCRPRELAPLDTQPQGSGSKIKELDVFKSLVKLKYNNYSPNRVPLNMISNSKPPGFLDSNVFTFRPKVSSTSVKIVENLGTDFMSRQQQHLQKQKKHIEQATLHFRTFSSRLSPVNSINVRRSKDKFNKENEENCNHNSMLDNATDIESSSTQPVDGYDENFQTDNSESMPPLNRTKTSMSPGLQIILDGPYDSENTDTVMKKQKGHLASHQFKSVRPIAESMEDDEIESENGLNLNRSKTMPALCRPKLSRKTTFVGNADRLKHAKEVAEKAIKQRKIFTIQGGYSAIRHSMRRRGWVEKFYRIPEPSKRSNRKRRKTADDGDDDNNMDDSDDDDDDDDDGDDSDNDQPKVPPWEEEEGVYGIMSRIVRNVNPTFIWVLKTNTIDYRFLTRDQMVNHYVKAWSFTTKVGLTMNMKNVSWFENADPETFYPRSYRLSHDEDKGAFIDDYRMTACISILKIIMGHYMEGGECDEERREQGGETYREDKEEEKQESDRVSQPKSVEECPQESEVPANSSETAPACTNSECTRSRPNGASENVCIHTEPETRPENENKPVARKSPPSVSLTPRDRRKKKKKKVIVPIKALEVAVQQCEKFLICKEHDDIDLLEEPFKLTDSQWDELVHWYYQLVHENGLIQNVPQHLLGLIETLLTRMKHKCPQFELDGTKNVWIVKPGAKSRGRGIVCYDHLEDMLKLVNSQVVRKDNKYVVQKYIERPLLVYNCKFDIRQWFLVTDWNPLTLWFYQDSYLRFCSQQYTLDNFDESIHLSNNAVQKNYKNGERSSELPEENMWTHDEFKDFIRKNNHGNLWDELIYPGMKKAIICSLLATQDLIDYRKSSFELYGADFMLTEDYSPWLIEINSSPSMESSTAVTAKMCADVLEDTIKVAVDRKFDRNCDIGRFELAYKQPIVSVPPYIGINLSTEGQAIRKPPGFNKRNNDSNQSQDISPRREFGKLIITNDKPNADFSKNPASLMTLSSKRPHSENPDSTSSKHATKSAPVKSTKSLNDDAKENINIKVRKSPSQYRSIYGTHIITNVSGNRHSLKVEELESSKGTSLSPHPPPSYLRPTFNSANQNNTYMNTISGRRIVSKTSVSNSYSLPGMDGKERPTLAVNNVESTDLRSIKATRGNFDDSGYKIPSFPVKPFRNKQKTKRPAQKRKKALIRSTNSVIRFPRVPYASVNIALKATDVPKFRYYNMQKSNENLYYTEVKCVDIG